MLIGAFFSKDKARMMFLLTLLSWAFALFAAKIIRSTILKGPKTPFVMELPPYRAPTIAGLLIHTWERTWQYIKKAGTVILAFSVLLWAMMTFPGLTKDQVTSFEEQRKELAGAFFDAPDIRGLIKGQKDLTVLDEIYSAYVKNEKQPVIPPTLNSDVVDVARLASQLEDGKTGRGEIDDRYQKAASRYLELRTRMSYINQLQQQSALKRTIAGWMGQRLEIITRPLGFDYRTNIALVGGFVAKEVVVSTLGTAYSLGEVDPEKTGSISEQLRQDPSWNPLQAFMLIVFTMLYVPCIATVIIIRRESSLSWAGFSIAFNLVIAYAVSLCIRQVGVALEIGV